MGCESRMIWVDIEMTGLDIKRDRILEVAALITDKNLSIIAEVSQDLIVHQPREVLDGVDDWCKETHGKNGLTEESLKSEITIEQADKMLVEFLRNHTPYKKCPLAGNSVYSDKKFMEIFMPLSFDHMFHRVIDVSSISEVLIRWNPEIRFYDISKPRHRALDDIKRSVRQLRFYKKMVFDKLAQVN
ncbi:Oligoribonuclease, mitochondrial [Thelohanellus kitauei]|uniref:Oligoribonuclease, mitochondrial n=1 Tax=Thelohanellus kitauei TaxID=669202 RepID=A0A0C2INT8_THEKT|nr:Oligoribonuclease, mitochondrial [Thelohanellus kitauei]